MISLPLVSSRVAQASEERHPWFLEGLRLGKEGLEPKAPKNCVFDQCVPSTQQCSNYCTLLFESSARYFVIGDFDCVSFRILHRAVSGPGDDQERRSIRQERICIPEYTEQVRIHHEQIFFKTEAAIYIYTPYSTSVLSVAAVDIWLDHYLYVLTDNRILVYGERLIDEIEFEIQKEPSGKQRPKTRLDRIIAGAGLKASGASLQDRLSKVMATGEAIYLGKYNCLYKIIGEECVFAYDCIRPIRALLCDDERVYALCNNHVLSFGLYDNVAQSTYTGVEHGRLFVSDSLLILYNLRNGTMFLDKKTLAVLHSEMFDSEYQTISVYDRCISYLASGSVLTHTNECLLSYDGQLPPKESIPLYYAPARFLDLPESLKQSPADYDLGKELQSIIDEGGKESPAPLPDPPETATCEAFLYQQGIVEPESNSEDAEESSSRIDYSEECTWNGNINDSEETSKVSLYLETVTKRKPLLYPTTKAKEDRGGAPVSYTDSSLITGITNPPTPDLTAHVYQSGKTIRTYFKKGCSGYKRSHFFVKNHFGWFESEFNALKATAPVPLSDHVYNFIESKLSKDIQKRIATSVPQKTKQSDAAAPSKKKKRGGF